MDNSQWIAWGAVLFNIGYVILAAKRNVLCWPVGIVGLLLSLVVYLEARLFSDATLQVSYLFMSLYGWYVWYQKKTETFILKYLNLSLNARLLVLGTLSGLALGWFWNNFGADLPYWDGLTTSFSLIATWMTAQKYLQSWTYWIVIDVVCIGIYTYKGIDAFAVLFAIYTILAIWGYRKWRKARIQDVKVTASAD